ncbi:MAG: hypothetical protein KIS76_06545 [Pyrinomonadaceae bacterium]|nr:hypothetical protein [Pyrinomonadaceae bacterium]
MTEIAETFKQSQKSSFFEGFWFLVVFGLSASIFLEFIYLPFAWLLAGLLATCVSYFTLSKPRVAFIKYFAVIQTVLLVTLTVVFFIPRQLREIIPKFWAYAFPLFLVSNVCYFVPPLDGSKRGAWWKWFLGSFVFAGLFGWIMSYLAK